MKFNVVANYDVIIIGSGISGLLCAIELAKHNKSIFIATKEAVTESSSLYAQGGMAVPLSEIDSVEKHLEDTIRTGGNLTDVNLAKKIISYSKNAFERLISLGVQFDLAADKTIHQTKEAAHTYPRVVHVGGDASGRFITKALIDNACREPNISISQGTTALQIILDSNNTACGVLFEDIAKHRYVVTAKHIIIATGGLGQIYKNTSNPLVSTGDGLVMAYNAGADLQDLEMIQFHPTVFLGNVSFLITEAIRGEGAKLKNINGEYFAKKYHKDADLAPRDVLTRAILKEMELTKSNHVFLDLSMFKEEYFKERFPTVYSMCVEQNVDLFKSGIPVAPAAHYLIGGIKVNENGKTNINSLWAVGECSSSGLHGANRLASNSLLECIAVPQFLTQELIKTKRDEISLSHVEINSFECSFNEKEINETLEIVKEKNLIALGPTRDKVRLLEHKDWLQNTIKKFNSNLLSDNLKHFELNNILQLSYLICQAAILRNNSLGVHFREDATQQPDEYSHITFNILKNNSVDNFSKALI